MIRKLENWQWKFSFWNIKEILKIFYVSFRKSFTFSKNYQSESCMFIWIIKFCILYRYTFLCGKLFASDPEIGKTYRTLCPAVNELENESILFNSLTRFKFFDDCLWLSLFGRPSFSRFSRVQRLICIMAMLFLSMVCNAMWFKGQEEDNSTGIEIGPFKLTYREFFVGITSSALTLPPAMIISCIYRRRKFRGENQRENGVGVGCMVHWWCIFIGYGMASAAIACASTITIAYSLQWGHDTSIEWLTAFFIGTFHGIFVFDPVKVTILIISVDLYKNCLCISQKQEHSKMSDWK